MIAMNKYQIMNFLEAHRDAIHSFGVRKIGLFGSYVRDAQGPESDIDLLVDFDDDKLNYDNYINLAYYLEDELDTKVDLITVGGLSPHIGPNILKEVEYVSL